MNKFENTISALRENGIVAIPVFENKVCNCGWKNRNEFTESEWGRAIDIAIKTGQLIDDENYSLLCIDIDTKDEEILAMFTRALIDNDWQHNQYYFEESVHGYHYIILVEGNEFTSQKLWWQDNDKCLIETKAGVAYVRVAPTQGFKKLSGKNLEDLNEAWEADEVRKLLSLLVKEKPMKVEKQFNTSYTCTTEFTDSPADDMRQNPWKVVAALQSNGWSLLKEDGNRWYLQRPGATGSDNHSVTIAKKGGAVTVWSSMLNSSQSETISPMTFLSNEFYFGDDKKLASEWRVNAMSYLPPVSLSEEEKAMIERITENMKKKENKAVSKENWDFSIEAAIMYGSAHKDEMKTSLPDAIYNSSSRIREMIDYISDKNDGCRIGSFAAAWTAAGMVCGRKVIEQHAQDNKVKQCSTAQYTFAFAPSGCGKSAGEGLIKMVCDEYNRPLYAIEKEREESESEAYEIAKHEWENADKASRGPAPKKPEKARWFKRMFNQAASSQALFEDLANRTDGKILVCVDEARDYLNAIADRYAKQYLSDIRTTYKKAFTSELGEIVNETSLSQRSKGNTSEYRIYHPSISTYYSGVSPASWDEYSDCVEDGTFGRFNFFFFDDDSENVIVCSNSREQRFNWKETSIKSWVRSWAMREDEQLVEWTDGALRMLAKFLMEVRTEKRKWASKNALFADCVAHSPLRFVKAALLYAVIDKDNDEDLRFARIDEEACRKAYTFMMYQFAMMMNVFNLAEGMQESDIIRTMREYTKSVCDDNGWFTVKALLASGFTWRGWNKNTAAGKLKTMSDNREGIEWNGKINKYTAFRIQTLEDED